MAECPTCGDTFDSTGGMRYHHARVHGESIAGDEVTCDNCGVSFRRNPAKISGSGRLYCSQDCQKWGYRPDISKDELYQLYWGSQKTTREIADHLGCEPNTVQAILADYGIQMVGLSRTHDAWIFRMRPDAWLRREYHDNGKSTYQIAHENGVYYDWVRKQLHERGIKPRDPGFVGYERGEWPSPKYDYGPTWQDRRLQALKRDRFTCQGCGTREYDLDGSLHVHHIRPFPTFDDAERANRVTNLKSFCPDCHTRWEDVPVMPSLSTASTARSP